MCVLQVPIQWIKIKIFIEKTYILKLYLKKEVLMIELKHN